jgi:hypothetical protein
MFVDDEHTDAERAILHAAKTGELVDLRTRELNLDDATQGQTWDLTRAVRAEVLVELLTGRKDASNGRPRAVKLRGARVTGTLDLEASTLLCPLLLQDCHLDQPINLSEAIAPSISLPGCHLPGIMGNQLVTRGNLALNEGFTAHGEVTLVGAHVGGALNFRRAYLSNTDGYALQAARLTVDGTMFCDDGFTAHGKVGLIGTHVGSVLAFSGASLNNPNGIALLASRLTVEGAMLCGGGFTARGQINLLDAHIGGMFVLDGARLANSGDVALVASGLTVDGEMSCRDGFTSHGQINLFGAHITGRLDFRGASLTNPDGLVLDLERMRTAAFYLLPIDRPDGAVDLTNAQIGNFYDDEETWPTMIRLRGLVYESLENDSVSVRARLRWLTLHEGAYVPGIYDQLAAAYRRAGHVEASRLVSIAKQQRRRRELNLAGKGWNWLLYVTVGYGYRTWWAGLWLLTLLVIGSLVFSGAHPLHMLPAAAVTPAFQPVAYTLDVLVPVMDLGQRKAWLPLGAAQVWSWSLTGAGWVLTTAVIAGLTNALRRD